MKNKFFLPTLLIIFSCAVISAQTPADSCKGLICFAKQKTFIPLDFIKKQTLIDTAYIHKNVFFTGSAVYPVNENYSAVIVDCKDGLVCTYKFILIVDLKTNINTDYIIGKTDCDRDGDSEFYSYDFSIKEGIIKVMKKHTEEGEYDARIAATTNYVVTGEGKLKKK